VTAGEDRWVRVLVGCASMHDHPVERMMRDAKVTQVYEATNQIQRLAMARGMLCEEHVCLFARPA